MFDIVSKCYNSVNLGKVKKVAKEKRRGTGVLGIGYKSNLPTVQHSEKKSDKLTRLFKTRT